MKILVTNDDGVTHPGLLALVQEMRNLGEVTTLAPDRNWSASGHVKTLERPLRVREVRLADGSPAWSTDGAPSDCVALAVLGLFPQEFDLVVSGINPNLNIGHDVTYSGTVTAAMEAAISGLTGVAVSLQLPDDHLAQIDFGPAARVARRVVATLIESRGTGGAAGALPRSLILNVNVPYLPDEQIRGIRVTRQGLRIYRDQLVRRLDPRGRPYYWIGGEEPTAVKEDGTDFGTISEGYVSVTPLQLDLTDVRTLEALRGWEWKGAV